MWRMLHRHYIRAQLFWEGVISQSHCFTVNRYYCRRCRASRAGGKDFPNLAFFNHHDDILSRWNEPSSRRFARMVTAPSESLKVIEFIHAGTQDH